VPGGSGLIQDGVDQPYCAPLSCSWLPSPQLSPPVSRLSSLKKINNPSQQKRGVAARRQRERNRQTAGGGSPGCPPPTSGSTPRPRGTQPHRLGGPFGHPLAPRGLLEASAFPRDRLPALVLAARLDLPDVHPAVLAEGLPAVRQLGERGGWGETRAVRGRAAGSVAGRAPTGPRTRAGTSHPPRAGQVPWGLGGTVVMG